ncbi:protein D2 [Fopius arisanus]|uniref:Protein D2 n=1 Tax=Fopius arisanus TaxID=64838 RepID=A0A9R1T4M9_9HYME|nr:PREDICTED: protein D2-like [Fopius arisanus]
MRQITVILVYIVGMAFADVKSAFEATEIVPDALDNAPLKKMEVKYGGRAMNIGDDFTPTETKDIPEIHYEYESGCFYTLIKIDLDPPSRRTPKFREFQHWIVGNIPEDRISEGEVFSEYVGAAPPHDAGAHRYVFLVYKQPGKLNFNEKHLGDDRLDGRANFSAKKFAVKYQLGEPIAGNMYQAVWDDYVPIFYKHLGVSPSETFSETGIN